METHSRAGRESNLGGSPRPIPVYSWCGLQAMIQPGIRTSDSGSLGSFSSSLRLVLHLRVPCNARPEESVGLRYPWEFVAGDVPDSSSSPPAGVQAGAPLLRIPVSVFGFGFRAQFASPHV